ncbi:uncharacterized protein LOC128278052 [Anopheles cruzii]|uniref:uncharacterized protein LOC128278052 n=1 Tax=Anopheles cruzii TaxID=68878 RepID=UPI0022EC320F|nr:uncharacterized protein LOC128278052 [Anopheles cruzii]
MAPPHVHMLLEELPSYFDPSMSIERIDRICREEEKVRVPAHSDTDEESSNSELQDANTESSQTVDLRDCAMLKRAIEQPTLHELMNDITQEVRIIRRKAGVFDQYDNWQYLSKKICVDHFLTFVYGLTCLAEYDPAPAIHRKLALDSTRLYIVLLSTPGQKQTNVFDEQVFQKCLDIFKMADQLRDPIYADAMRTASENRLLLDYIAVLDDLLLLLGCMTLKNCESEKLYLVQTLKNVLNYCIKHTNDRAVAEQLAEKVFETLGTLCLPEHDDHNECATTISTIFNKTAMFYQLEYKNSPPVFQVYNFFLRLLEQYPTDASNVLANFIKSVLTNPPKVFARADELNYLLDVAVKYELAMYSKCNISIIDYVEKIEAHAESGTRINIVEIISKLALVDCTVNWVLFQSEISKVPREIKMIRLLYNKLIEKNCVVKLKALQCLLRIMQNGNQVMKKLILVAYHRPYAAQEEKNYLQMHDVEELYRTAELELGISRNSINLRHSSAEQSSSSLEVISSQECSSDDQQKASSTVEGIDELNDVFDSLPNVLYGGTLSSNSAIRRVSLSCIGHICELDRNRIDDVFDYSITKLAKDPVMLTRRATLNVLNKLLTIYPNYLPLIKLWSKCLLYFLDDVDQKLKEFAMESLKMNVFDSICRFEDSSSNKTFTPWMIVRSILVLGKINVLKTAVDSWIQKSILTPKVLSIIESHIFTVNCSEAWIILSIIANKMKSRNPDVVIKTMNDILQRDVYNSPICLQYILSVVKSWIGDFTSGGLNHLFKILNDLLRTGSTNISLVSDIYSLCCMIKEKSDGIVSHDWITSIRDSSAQYLLHYHSHYTNLHTTNERYLISLLVYAEAATDLNLEPDRKIMKILIDHLTNFAPDEQQLSDADENRKTNVTIIVLARFALRDGSLAATVIHHFTRMLKFKNINESIICTLITAFSDLCKRHTSLVDSSISTMVGQLNSRYLSVRSVALNNLNELILQDYIKMRGKVLLNILQLIIDEEDHIAAQAMYVIQLYVHSKNDKLLKISLLECVYVFNNYMQYADSDMFPTTEISSNDSCELAGNDPTSMGKRINIYDFFIENIDDTSLLKLLKNVNKIHHQLVKNKYVECLQGVLTLLDLLYVFKRLVQVKDRDKIRMGKIGALSNDNETNDSQLEEAPSIAKKSRLANSQIAAEREVTVIVEKMIAVYFNFQQESRKYVQKVEPQHIEILNQRLHDLALAIAKHFRGLVEFAKPMSFWQSQLKLVEELQPTGLRKQTRKRRGKTDAGDVTDSDEEPECTDMLDTEEDI